MTHPKLNVAQNERDKNTKHEKQVIFEETLKALTSFYYKTPRKDSTAEETL